MKYESYMQCLIRSNAFETMCLCRGGARVAKCIIIPHSLACKIVTQKLHPHQREKDREEMTKEAIYIYIYNVMPKISRSIPMKMERNDQSQQH